MIKKLILLIIMFSFFYNANAKSNLLATSFSFNGIDGNVIDLGEYKDKIIVVVNVASRCGFTNQYEDLQTVWTNYKSKDLIVVGVPSDNFRQEPSSNKEIKDFCETTFGVDFAMTEKTNVIGKNAHPFFLWAKENYGMSAIPKWNFHKIIVGKDGKVIDTFSSIAKPTSKKFIRSIEEEIKN